MSFLLLDQAGKERAHEVALFASRRENWFRPGDRDFVPGDGKGHMTQLGSYRCVFTFTVAQGRLLRHLSVAVSGAAAEPYPHPFAIFTLASWFGFTGGKAAPPPASETIVEHGDDWILDMQSEPVPFVAVWQLIGPEPPR